MNGNCRSASRSWGWAVAASSLFWLSGCGSGTYPVSGKVVYEDGTPVSGLAGGFVTFQSAEEKTSAQGSIRRDATFTLTTYTKADGALPGLYRVVITPPPYMGSEAGPSGPPLLDPRYRDFSTSDLQWEVKPERNDAVIKLRRPGY